MALNVPNPPLLFCFEVVLVLAVDKHGASITESAWGPGPASRFDALSSVEAAAPARQAAAVAAVLS